MNTEQLQMILETLNGAGEGAKEVAVWYIIAPIIQTVVITLTILTAVWFITKAVVKCVIHENGSKAMAVSWRQICHQTLGVREARFAWDEKDVHMATAHAIEKIKDLKKV